MKKRTKRYDDGGLTFAEMDDADRDEAARKAIADLDARQAAKSEEAVEPKKRSLVKRAKKVDAGDTRENLRDLDMQGADTGYDASEKARMAKQTQGRHFAGRPGKSAEPQVVEPKKKGAVSDLVDIFSRGGKYLMKTGGKVTASKRADGCAVRGKTKGRIV